MLAGAAELSTSLFASTPTSAAGEATESSFAMLHGLYWLTANFASRTPTLLVVDDLHWADEPSLRWLHYLARRSKVSPSCFSSAPALLSRPIFPCSSGRVPPTPPAW